MSLADEIRGGESRSIELKEMVPRKSEAYLKTVVAFANGRGGKIVFGVEDGTRRIVGIDPENVYGAMDSIANAISDACHPAVRPNIWNEVVDGKTVIVVDVPAGTAPPYQMGAKNLDGVYVRVGATTRPADQLVLKELILAGSNLSFDQQVCQGLAVTSDDINALCRAMKEEAIRNAPTDERKKAVRDLGMQQMLSWGILMEKDGEILPTNAYAILTGSGPLRLVTQCGIFRGITRDVFLDRQEYAGPIWEQIGEAYRFVLRNIRLGAEFVGLHRVDLYELPVGAIRELVINAALHRDYIQNENTQVALYDDRLEVTSPGGLPRWQTPEGMRNGRSMIRNEALASAFSYMNLIERWGSGVPRIIRSMSEIGLREPEFAEMDEVFRVNIYRDVSDPSSPGHYLTRQGHGPIVDDDSRRNGQNVAQELGLSEPNRKQKPGPSEPNREQKPGPNEPNREQEPGPNEPNKEQELGPNEPNKEQELGPNEPNKEQELGPNEPNREQELGPNEPNKEQELGPNEPNREQEWGLNARKRHAHMPDEQVYRRSDAEWATLITELLRRDPSATLATIASSLSVSVSTVKRQMKRLNDQGMIERLGPRRGGKWIVVDHPSDT